MQENLDGVYSRLLWAVDASEKEPGRQGILQQMEIHKTMWYKKNANSESTSSHSRSSAWREKEQLLLTWLTQSVNHGAQ